MAADSRVFRHNPSSPASAVLQPGEQLAKGLLSEAVLVRRLKRLNTQASLNHKFGFKKQKLVWE